MTDYKALYEAQVQENEMLRDLIQNKMPVGCIAETTYQPILDQNEKLKEERDKLKEDIDGDGWLKQGYKTDLSNSHKQQNRMIKELSAVKKEIKQIKKKSMKSISKLGREKKDLKALLAAKEEEMKEEEEEVDTCAKCNKKRECLSDMFITHDETMTGGEKYMMCGMCSLNHFT